MTFYRIKNSKIEIIFNKFKIFKKTLNLFMVKNYIKNDYSYKCLKNLLIFFSLLLTFCFSIFLLEYLYIFQFN